MLTQPEITTFTHSLDLSLLLYYHVISCSVCFQSSFFFTSPYSTHLSLVVKLLKFKFLSCKWREGFQKQTSLKTSALFMISMLMSLPTQFRMHNKAKAMHETVKVTQQQQICQALSSSIWRVYSTHSCLRSMHCSEQKAIETEQKNSKQKKSIIHSTANGAWRKTIRNLICHGLCLSFFM